MTAEQVQTQIEKLESEIVALKAEMYDRLQAIEHLKVVAEAMTSEQEGA